MTTWLFSPSLGILQNLRPAIVCPWVNQELRGDQHLAWGSLRNAVVLQTDVATYGVAGVWLQMEEHPHNTHSSYRGCSHWQSFYSVRWLFACRILKGMRLLISHGIQRRFSLKSGLEVVVLVQQVLYRVIQGHSDPLNFAFSRTLVVLLRWSSQNWTPSLEFQAYIRRWWHCVFCKEIRLRLYRV